jgi:hypothetical protein
MPIKIDSVDRNMMVAILFKWGYSMQKVADGMGLDGSMVEEIVRQRLNLPQR